MWRDVTALAIAVAIVAVGPWLMKRLEPRDGRDE